MSEKSADSYRKSVGNYDDFKNCSWPPFENYTTSHLVNALTTSVLGLPLNLLVVYFSFISTGIDGVYKYFLGNLAALDVLYCLGMIWVSALQYTFIVNDWPINAFWCSAQAIPALSASFATTLALPLISLNRFLLVVKQSNWFSKRNIALTCIYPLITLFWSIGDFAFSSKVTYYQRCGYMLFTPGLPEIFILPIAFGYILLTYCNWKLYQKISEHIHHTQQLLGSKAELADERALLKAIIIQAIVPPVLVAPALLYSLAIAFFGHTISTVVIAKIGPFRPTVDDLVYNVYTWAPSIDALITLTMVKPYKRACRNLIRGVTRKCFCRRQSGREEAKGEEATNVQSSNDPKAVVQTSTSLATRPFRIVVRSDAISF